ncbi:KAP family P-loop NTPase fold protein [Pasteurella multocida]|uniref:KAP family P-loop NTPase fold protein n=1 Tax=Pasteurella multocida TaxID=747 RepID=UPI00397A92EF
MELISDNPIKNRKQDLLDRTNNAEAFANHIFSFDYQEGLVIGICGEWGSGKTSYINLMRPKLEENSIVIDFNPWMFSDAHNLVALFFQEMGTQLKNYQDSIELANILENFGDLLSNLKSIPYVGEFFSMLGGLITFGAKKKKGDNSLQDQRNRLITELKEVKKPITVILDDIDRLSGNELESILKLVRVTGNFPNIIYLLSFDRERVANTLETSNFVSKGEGHIYLEKIIQVPFDIPKISRQLLENHLFSSLNSILGDVQLDQNRWSDAYWDIIKPTIKNVRDIRRYVSSLSYTSNQIGKSIDIVDLLLIELIKIFYPQKFKDIFELRDYLISQQTDEKFKHAIKKFTKENEIYSHFLEKIFDIYSNSEEQYFSSDNEYRKKRRIAHKTFFDLYFNQILSSDFQEIQISEKLWLSMSSKEFKEHLSGIDANSLENIVKNLIDYEDDFDENHALIAIPALYANLPRVPEKEREVFDIEPDRIWHNLTHRLMEKIPESTRIKTISNLLNSCDLFGQLEIVRIIGHRENIGRRLVSENNAKIFEKTLLNNIQKTSIEELIKTYNLSQILHFFISEDNSINNNILEDENILFSLLKSSVYERRASSSSTPVIKREKILSWDLLVKIYENEDNLKKAIDRIEENENLNQETCVQLAIKYKNGWRPSNNFGYEDDIN